jgi:alginate O-acetyltransferase complex protein AlgI
VLFNSYIFLLVFLPVSLLGYYSLGHYANSTAAKFWLAIASFVFYGWWNPAFVVLLLLSIAVNYALSVLILDAEAHADRQRMLLTLGIVLNLSVLVYYKYLFVALQFFHAHAWLSTDFGRVILPLGISFFTFTQIGYLVDSQQGMVKEKNLLNYTLFVTFFPHLIAGPILHHREIMPQFADRSTYRFDSSKVASGLTLFAIGLVKKVVLADSIAPWAESGFAHAGQIGMLTTWSTILAYSMQLYFDFSGYSDMAIGLGSMFGVRLPLNFNSPYKSTSIIDFWQRWHMTLTRYLTLLIYNPISLWITRHRMARGLPANRKASHSLEGFVSLVAFPTCVTMLLAGVWHGAGLQFVIWGGLHALYLIINHAWRIFGPKPLSSAAPRVLSGVDHVWRVILTYACVLLAQIFFRADSVADARKLLAGVVGSHGYDLPLSIAGFRLNRFGPVGEFFYRHGLIVLSPTHTLWDTVTKPLLVNSLMIMGMALIVWGAPNSIQLMGLASPALQKIPATRWRLLVWKPNVVWGLLIAVSLYYVLTQLDQPGRFLYFQF